MSALVAVAGLAGVVLGWYLRRINAWCSRCGHSLTCSGCGHRPSRATPGRSRV